LRELALHILDIAENCISAGASTVRIAVNENIQEDELWITIEDNGKGMDAELLENVMNPFVTSRSERKVGLGIPMLKQAAEACAGFLEIDSEPGKGTRITAKFRHSHIDRMPLGDLADSFLTLFFGTPEVNWVLDYQVNDQTFHFDDTEVKQILDGVPLTDYRIIELLTATVRGGIEKTFEIGSKQGVSYAQN